MQKRSEETRARIMLAAVAEFGENGYEATSVSRICQASGVSKGAFYHHFPSKQALFLELLGSWLTLLDQQFNLVRSQADNVPEALIRMTGLMGDIYQTAGGNLPMFIEFWNQAGHDPEVWGTVIAPYRRYQEYFAGMIQEGIDERSLKPVDPQKTARVMVALAVGLLLQGALDPEGADWQDVTQYGFEMILNDLLFMETK
jgi:AcrR family transcriptional regulator